MFKTLITFCPYIWIFDFKHSRCFYCDFLNNFSGLISITLHTYRHCVDKGK